MRIRAHVVEVRVNILQLKMTFGRKLVGLHTTPAMCGEFAVHSQR